MATKKKYIKTSLLLVLSAFALTACGEIIVKPGDYNSPIITGNEVNNNIANNIMSTVYDEIHSGSLPTDVLDKTLFKYSVSMFGKYNGLSEGNVDGEITLKEAAKFASNKGGSQEKFNEFVNNHEVYWVKDNEGNRVANSIDGEKTKVLAKWNTIEERIAENMYSKMGGSDGSYSFRKYFSEKKFLTSLIHDLEKVSNDKSQVKPDQLVTPDVEKSQVFEFFLTRSNYQYHSGLDEDENDTKTNIKFVEEEIIPGIYRDLLTEEYINQRSYASIGRSYARKVNIITVENNEDYSRASEVIMKDFFVDPNNSESFNRKPNVTTTVSDSTNKVSLDDFKKVSRTIKGYEKNDETLAKLALLPNSPFVAYPEGDNKGYYEGTEYSSVLKTISKINQDNSIYEKFTNNGEYTWETGRELAKNDIALKEHVTNGWFVKEGLSSFSTFVDKLFNLQVTSALDANIEGSYDAYDRYYYDNGAWVLGGRERDYNDYVCRINGTYYLKNMDNDKLHPERDILWENNGTYYVVQVLEAVSSAKLNPNSKSAYESKKLEEVKNSILKIIGNTSSYSTLAKEYWLKQMNLKYYDDDVYNYFKTNFPNLFE